MFAMVRGESCGAWQTPVEGGNLELRHPVLRTVIEYNMQEFINMYNRNP